MTKKEMFQTIATLLKDNGEVVAFCNHEIELLNNKKASKRTGLTKAQKENARLVEELVAYIVSAGCVTVKDVEQAFSVSNQKATSLLKIATKDNKLIRHEGRGKIKTTWEVA